MCAKTDPFCDLDSAMFIKELPEKEFLEEVLAGDSRRELPHEVTVGEIPSSNHTASSVSLQIKGLAEVRITTL